jgi:hypothetical protein
LAAVVLVAALMQLVQAVKTQALTPLLLLAVVAVLLMLVLVHLPVPVPGVLVAVLVKAAEQIPESVVKAFLDRVMPVVLTRALVTR